MIIDDEAFVDLYEVLELSPQADVPTLRQRISEMYLEARNNLEHQSHRKRFYYRELYELHLPRARQIFLDKAKRAEYDLQLQEYLSKSGRPPSIHKPRDRVRSDLSNLPATTKTAADGSFADFSDFGDDLPLPPMMPTLRMNPQDVERRRNHKRRELIKHELITQGMQWGAIGAGVAAILLLPVVAAIFRELQLHSVGAYTFGFSTIIVLSGLASRQAARYAKRRAIATLSQMPYDELLRQCGS